MLKSIFLSALAIGIISPAYADGLSHLDPAERDAAARRVHASVAAYGSYRTVVEKAKDGDANALFLISELRRAGIEGDDADWETPLREAAEAGHLEARANVARLDADDDSLHADKLRADAGQRAAMQKMADRYENADGVAEDRDIALFLRGKLSPSGAGDNAHPDLAISLDAIHHRIRMGDASALRDLAELYLNGWRVQRDYHKAVRLLEAAAPFDPIAKDRLRQVVR